ncbi:hypothetical protein KTQ74_05380 [Pseudomonas chlororaphis]|uniref:DUF6875 domain-containing protein n=1 Tax=Pseudomonas chlororaphis TaxID=587753 RepID=UPI001E4A52DE|nr:hypothetical protein [Pseudomonas chlororaphis]MCB2251320.1 hypothetical protein [Pseudomonas chlororaphis]
MPGKEVLNIWLKVSMFRMNSNFYSISEFNEDRVPGFAANAYKLTLPYVTQFLTARHPHRNGAVCPFVAGALKNETLYFSFADFHEKHDWAVFIEHCIKFMNSKRVDNKPGRALIILLPENFDLEVLLRIHVDNKVKCVESFLMLGALYKESNAKSLHSADFFPLRTPTPTLVIREITAGDLVFLEPGHYSMATRLKFLGSYVRRFATPQSSAYEMRQVAISKKIITQYRMKMAWDWFFRVALLFIVVGAITVALAGAAHVHLQ